MRLEDIAKKVGVSRSTVSRVLNNAPDVSEKTRQKIHAAIEEMGYQPNAAARMLASRQNRVIGIVIRSRVEVAFDASMYLPTLLQGISDAVHERGYLSLIWLGSDPQHDAEFQQKILSTSLVDGLVVASAPREDDFIDHLLAMNIPFVLVEKPTRHLEQVHYVSIDNVSATNQLLTHLIDLGRKKIGIITGNQNNPDFAERLQAYQETLLEHDLSNDEALIIERLNQIDQLLVNDVDTIFATNDAMAIQTIQYLQARGIQVPQQIAVVGFDDSPLAAQSIPLLTTIKQPIDVKGIRATELLIDLIEGSIQDVRHVHIPTQLIIRESCGANS